MMTVGIVGLGLIGGSLAKAYKSSGVATVLGYDLDASTKEFACLSGVLDGTLTRETLRSCDLILFAIPPRAVVRFIRDHADDFTAHPMLIDCAGTKRVVCDAVFPLAKEHGFLFLGGHPMAGSEKTGYENSTDHLLENAYYIISPTKKNTPDQIEQMRQVALSLRAIPLVLDYEEHDFSVAAISHLPHLIASSLVKLVKDNDGETETMKRIAAGGFKDITRIASSSPVMWEQICMTNTDNLKVLMRRYIDSLESIYEDLDSHNGQAIYDLFDESGRYRDTFSSVKRGPVAPNHSFSVDVVDEPGSIAILSAILASRGINVKNIGINNARDYGEGALRIEFYSEEKKSEAADLLKRYNYNLTR